MLPALRKVSKHHLIVYSLISLCAVISIIFSVSNINSTVSHGAVLSLATDNTSITHQLAATAKELDSLKKQDQVVINKKNTDEIKNIHDSFLKTKTAYEQLLDLKLLSKKTEEYDKLFALSLKQLSDKDYKASEGTIADLTKKMTDEKNKIVAASAPAASGPSASTSSNTPPGSGYSVQSVNSDIGPFTVSLIAGDLGSTRVIVDTASDSDCHDSCPVLSLSDYVSRNGAYAGVNGTYFCPASYPSCAGKTNSFDLLVMNKNKHYFNSDNNIYSTNPAVIFQGGSVRFVSQALQWGRDTSPDSVISNFPLLILGGNIVFGGDGDPKKGSKGSRPFVANKGNIVYIGIVYNATVAEGAHALKALGMENAMNLDSGGSTALWYNGYKAGPGRNIPNAVLFVRK